MNVQFEGWRLLDATDVLRADDRWTYVPDTYQSPTEMFTVMSSHLLRWGKRTCDFSISRQLYVYRRIEP